MKYLIIFLSILISTFSFSQDIESSLMNHLDSIGIDRPVRITCIDDAAQFHANHLRNNKRAGHSQDLSEIGDTIIENSSARGYFFCDTSYEIHAEISGYDFFKDSADFSSNGASRIIQNFIDSPDHKKILESYHDYFGIGISTSTNPSTGEITAYFVIAYGESVTLGNPRYPAHYSINKDAEKNYRNRFDKYTIVVR